VVGPVVNPSLILTLFQKSRLQAVFFAFPA
jgi:hypothetical protein